MMRLVRAPGEPVPKSQAGHMINVLTAWGDKSFLIEKNVTHINRILCSHKNVYSVFKNRGQCTSI